MKKAKQCNCINCNKELTISYYASKEILCDNCKPRCSVSGCDNIIHGLGYCKRHHTQHRRGGIMERTIFDPNIIELINDYAEVSIYNIDHEIIAKIKIDIDDIELINKYKWSLGKDGYAQTRSSNITLRMHRLIFSVTDSEIIIDHIDRDKYNNRKQNLRIVDKFVNAQNHKLQSNNTSGHRGIHYYKRDKKYVVFVYDKGKKVYIGIYDDYDTAVIERKKAEVIYYGSETK